MRKVVFACVASLCAGSAWAGLPQFTGSCPGDIKVTSDQHGVHINGKKAEIKRYSDEAYDAKVKGLVISITAQAGAEPTLMYTGKHGANGICQVLSTGAKSAAAAVPGAVAVKDMARVCAGEASAKFKQRPANITTQPAIEDQGMYSVFGQFPPGGAEPTVFICTFSSDGKLVGVDKE
jgi:hypothetical protein